MYENKARLLCTAEGSPLQLFERIVTIADAQNMAPRTSSRSRKNDDFDLCVDNELGFAKDRTISRYELSKMFSHSLRICLYFVVISFLHLIILVFTLILHIFKLVEALEA